MTDTVERAALENVIKRPSSPEAETEILARLDRWRNHFGAPIGNGRANPDNDMWYLLSDAHDAISGLRSWAQSLERMIANRAVLASSAAESAADIDRLWLDLVEKDDRTSPVEYPDMALITKDELRAMLAAAPTPPVQPDAMVAVAQVRELIAIEPEYPSATLADVDRLIAEARETGASDSEIVLTAMRQVVRDTKASILTRLDACLPAQTVPDAPRTMSMCGSRADLEAANAKQSDEPVAWQWRYRTIGKSIGEWTEWSDGRAPKTIGSSYEVEERPLYTRPQPAKEVVEALEKAREALEIIAGKRQCVDNLMSNADVANAALASLSQEQG